MSIISKEWLDAHPGAVCKGTGTGKGLNRTRGYAATPGTGPQGETCRSCKHYAHNRGSEGRSKPYPKCGLMRPLWTNGPGTDIKARSPACSKWETGKND